MIESDSRSDIEFSDDDSIESQNDIDKFDHHHQAYLYDQYNRNDSEIASLNLS